MSSGRQIAQLVVEDDDGAFGKSPDDGVGPGQPQDRHRVGGAGSFSEAWSSHFLRGAVGVGVARN